LEYVYPGSPADVAGLTRGDFIVQIDGQSITDLNFRQLWSADNLNITTGIYSPSGISPGNTVSMISRKMDLDPVLIYKTIETEGHIIGYLFYAQFIPDFNSSLQQAFQFFKDKNITDLVVDLRYNPGGFITAAQFLCSSIAPMSVNYGTTLITLQFSDKYTPVKWPFLSQSQSLQPVRLGMNKVYFLTGQGSASASELTITGLDPYMDVAIVGDTTYCKYTASLFYTPDSVYTDKNYTKNIANWGIQPIIARYANAVGVTDFKNGFAPDFFVNEYAAENLPFMPLGDPNEPLLKEAIADITGIPVLATKKAVLHFPFTIVDRGFSKYDASKRNLMIDGFDQVN
jgi:C-terminal processing protease CtpA/Prc